MAAEGGRDVEVTHDRAGIVGLAWAAEGRGLIVSSRRQSSLQRLWFFPIAGGEPKCLTDAALAASWPAVSSKGRVAYASRFFDTNIWRIDLEGRAAPQRLIASNVMDSGAQYSPDASRIAFRSNRGGNDEVWVSDGEGRSSIRVSSFGGPTTGSAQWSPDGRTLLLESRPFGSGDIFETGSDGGGLRRITDAPSDEVLPRYSRDGQSIYFASNRGGLWQIWKQSRSGGAPRQITRQGGFSSYESDDGQWLFFRETASRECGARRWMEVSRSRFSTPSPLECRAGSLFAATRSSTFRIGFPRRLW